MSTCELCLSSSCSQWSKQVLKHVLLFEAPLAKEGICVRLANLTQDLKVTHDLAWQGPCKLEVRQDILGSTDGSSCLSKWLENTHK